MVDLSTTYMGLELSNPVIVSSSGLTQSLDSVLRCAEAGAGAVVLKSIFEEQILAEVAGLSETGEAVGWHPEAADYIAHYGREDALGAYLELVRAAKETVDIPIIASIHCVTSGNWTDFARRLEEAGADGLELNVFVLPSDPRRDGKANERLHFDVAKKVRRRVGIPIALKIGSYFSGLAQLVARLSHTGVDALVLFNRFVRLDFDIEAMRVVPASIYSSPDEMVVPLRWISILSNKVGCDLAATTGVHDATGVIKQLLAGASAVQVCSTLYQNGIEYLATIVSELEAWMVRRGMADIDSFRGRLSQSESRNPAAYERVQFMAINSGKA